GKFSCDELSYRLRPSDRRVADLYRPYIGLGVESLDVVCHAALLRPIGAYHFDLVEGCAEAVQSACDGLEAYTAPLEEEPEDVDKVVHRLDVGEGAIEHARLARAAELCPPEP